MYQRLQCSPVPVVPARGSPPPPTLPGRSAELRPPRERLPAVIGPSYFSITPAMNDSGATVFVANTHSFFIAALS